MNIDFSHLVRMDMMSDSKKIEEVPDVLYYGVGKRFRRRVEDRGIEAHEFFGVVYVCESREDCERLLAENVDVWKVNGRKLDKGLMRLSDDFSGNDLNGNVYGYFGDIKSEDICREKVMVV